MEGTEQRQIWCMLAYYNMPGIYEFEQVDYYFGFSSLHQEAAAFMADQLKCFHDNYWEWFNLAEYPDPEEMLTVEERSRIGEKLQPEEIGAVFDALSDVLKARLEVQSIEALKKAEELFNYIMDYGLSDYNGDRRDNDLAATWITIQRPESFGPIFVDHILKQIRFHESKDGFSTMGSPMVPFREVVERMKNAVQQKDWFKNDLNVGQLLMLINIYQTLAEDQD